MRVRNSLSLLALLGASVAFAAPAFAQQSIAIGQSVSGSLDNGDSSLSSGEYFDAYEFEGRAGQTLTIRLDSDAIDPYLMLRGPGSFSEDNDDVTPGERRAEITVRLPTNGRYRIIATSYAAGERGRYQLRLGAGNLASAPASSNSNGPRTINAGQSVEGALDGNDQTLPSGEYIETWTLQGRRGESFDVTLQSSAFDPYLIVRGPGGLSQDNDDADGRGTRNSRIRFTMPADGEVRIGATSFRSGEQGRYVLAVNGAGGNAPPPPPVAASGGNDAATLSPGQRVNGALASGDRQLSTGEYADQFIIDGRAGQRVELRLDSAQFDPFVQINGPGNFVEANDDDPSGGRNSRLAVTLPSDGRYTVMVTSYAARETGNYVLRYGEGATNIADAPPPARPADPARVTPEGAVLTLGRSVSGELASGDDTLQSSGEFVDHYRFSGRRGQRIAIDVASEAFDTYAILQPPEGDQIDNDDGPDGTNARIEQVLPADGEYGLLVTSYRPGESGRYTVTLSEAAEPARTANVRGGQRVFAVMVGVSDYGGAANNLPYTDEDANKIAETLRRDGVLNPASITITNGGATRSAVRSAIENVAAQAGPDDIFLFFYSGHGQQIDGRPSATEPDGRDEALTLIDGPLTDDEMAAMFAPLRTRLSLLILDSCFSGGFARDVVNRPGVMGVFSSEEDLTSLVAEKFRAGGYLAHFVRQAFSGDADNNGDRILSAGELAAYLRQQFNSPDVGLLEAETTDGQRNYQNLVIDRGGVQVDDVIVRLGNAPAAMPDQ